MGFSHIKNVAKYTMSFLFFPFCLQEILCILLTGGSVFLNALNLASGDKIINDLLPGNIEGPADKLTYSSVIPVFEHFNSDGQKELYFTFNAVFSLKPRGLYRLDVDSLKLYHSPELHKARLFTIFSDIRRDGISWNLSGNIRKRNNTAENEGVGTWARVI
jgi:hypothetical protein